MCFDFAFKLDQDKHAIIRKHIAMIHVAVLQSAMIFGYNFGYVLHKLAVWNHDPETSNECSVFHGALHPRDPPLARISADQAKGAFPHKVGGSEDLYILQHCDIFKIFQVF
jgi:hypothetical protein